MAADGWRRVPRRNRFHDVPIHRRSSISGGGRFCRRQDRCIRRLDPFRRGRCCDSFAAARGDGRTGARNGNLYGGLNTGCREGVSRSSKARVLSIDVRRSSKFKGRTMANIVIIFSGIREVEPSAGGYRDCVKTRDWRARPRLGLITIRIFYLEHRRQRKATTFIRRTSIPCIISHTHSGRRGRRSGRML